MQLINQDQHVQGETSRRSRNAIIRERDVAKARLMADYFGPSPKYPDYYFRRRYRMNRSLFLEIVQGFSTWMAFGGNTRDLGSFGEETDEITDLHQILKEVLLTERGDGVTSIKRRRQDYNATSLGRIRLNEDLESST
ncbi:hypothetical protein Tco_0368251 [Tanacetum coccineum]